MHGCQQINPAWHPLVGGTMRCAYAVAFAILGSTSFTFAQNDLPTFRTEGASAFVWGDDNHSSAVSSSIDDPVTGNVIHKLSHAGIEVSSQPRSETPRITEAA